MQEKIFAEPSHGDVDQGWALLSVCWAFVLCALITTVLRVVVRLKLTRNFGSDDITMVVAMMTTLVGAGLITVEVLNGLGRHMYYLEASQRRMFLVVGWADWIQTFITLLLTKVAICLFLMRIMDSRRLRFFLWGLIAFMVVFTTISIGFFLGVCRPLRAYWDVGVDGTCLSEEQLKNVVIFQGAMSVFSDLICAGFPILFLRDLQVKRRTKIALFVLMGLGVITAACCTVRTVISGVMTNPDITWAISANVGWRLPEVNIGIVCANAPVLRPLYLFYRGRLASQQRTSSAGISENSKAKMIPSSGNSSDKYHNGGHLEEKTLPSLPSPISPSSSISPWGQRQKHDATQLKATEESVELGLPVQGACI